MQPMSPLLHILMKALRIASLVVAALMAVFLTLAVWQKTSVGGTAALTRQDISFFVIVALLGLASLWMARSIGREIKKHGLDRSPPNE